MLEHSVGRFKGVERKLNALQRNTAIPPALVHFISQVVELQREASQKIPTFSVPESELVPKEKMLMGAPVLPRQSFIADFENAGENFDMLLELCRHAGGVLAENAQLVKQAEAEGTFLRRELFDEYIADHEAMFRQLSVSVPGTPKLYEFLASASLSPSLDSLAGELAQRIDKEKTWIYGHCPICGSSPMMARLEGKEGFRMLTCSFCHHEYKAKRLQCPYCLEENTDKLRYFTSQDAPGYQVHVCDSCHSYIKTADFRDLDRISYATLDDLESLPLDVAAGNEGFMRPMSSAWGF